MQNCTGEAILRLSDVREEVGLFVTLAFGILLLHPQIIGVCLLLNP